MELNLNRYACGDKATLGTLDTRFGDDMATEWRCYTLEDVDRGLEHHPELKINGQTCIPRGRYEIVITMSPRFKRELPRLLNVPGFEGVLIHTGNKPEDTEGCILVGSKPTSADFIPNSKVTFNELFKRIKSALQLGEKVWITIT